MPLASPRVLTRTAPQEVKGPQIGCRFFNHRQPWCHPRMPDTETLHVGNLPAKYIRGENTDRQAYYSKKLARATSHRRIGRR
jgi:hypothetical protein